MANFEIIAQKYPSGGDPSSTERLIFIDNGNGTFTMTVAAGDGTYPSLASSIVAGSGVLVQNTGGPATAGGANTQLQYNNVGVLGGIAGATTDGTITTFATGDLRVNNIADQAGTVFIKQAAANFWTFIGQGSGLVASAISLVALGNQALASNTTGSENVAIGDQTLNANVTGIRNTVVGEFAAINVLGSSNTFIGRGAGAGAGAGGCTGTGNIGIGLQSMQVFSTATNNTVVGQGTAGVLTTGGTNTIIGATSGAALITGGGNIFIGFAAGAAETGSNKLYIANSNTATPLIGGDFGAGTLQFNGTGGVTNYKGVATAGAGLVGVRAAGRSPGAVAAVASVSAFTLGAADASFEVSANVNVTVSTTHSFTVTVAYTDETNTPRVLTLGFTQLAGATLLSLITNITGAGPYEGIVYHIRAKASTTITIATTGTFTTVTYNVEGIIKQTA